ncbi:hypothetical protein Dimus_016783 [Dionaea muscipula]
MCSANRIVRDAPLAWKRKPDVVKPAGVSLDGRMMVKEGMSHDPAAGKAPLVNDRGAGEWQVVVGKRHGIRGGGSLSPDGKRMPDALVKGLDVSARILIHQQRLVGSFCMKDVRDALWDIGDDKSPGIDGFNALFFKRTWEFTGPLISVAVLHFF